VINDDGWRLVRVWDLPTRLFHWALLVLVICSFVTAEIDELAWHKRSGYCVLALLVFRLIWGMVGSDTARFTRFLRGPGAVWRYLQASGTAAPDYAVGHNPAGGWAVAAMLLVLCVQVGTGLFADDDISEAGPFAIYVERPTRRLLTGLHQANFWLLAGLVSLHILAISGYWVVRRQNLVWPMLTGMKSLPVGGKVPRLRSIWIAMAVFGLAVVAAVWVASFAS
jgi:cytochrome b